MIEDIVCYMFLYNSTSHQHVYKASTSTVDSYLDYEFDIAAGNFSNVGEYNYLIQCNNSFIGGFDSVGLVITASGDVMDEAQSNHMVGILIALILSSLGICFFLLYFGKQLDGNEGKNYLLIAVKVFCFAFALWLLFYPVSFTFSLIEYGNQTVLTTTGMAGYTHLSGLTGSYFSAIQKAIYIIIGFIAIYLVYLIFMALKMGLGGKKDE